MQSLIGNINSSSRIERKLDDKTKVIRVVSEYDPLYTGFVTMTVDTAESDLRICDYKNVRRFGCIRNCDGTQLLSDWYEIKIKK